MTTFGKRKCSYDAYSDDEPEEDYRVLLLAEAGRVPGLEINPRSLKKYNRNRNRKNRKKDSKRHKRPKLEDVTDEYILSRIIKNLNKPSNTKAYENCLMMSEWFRRVPDDFEDNWVMVPCPLGKRMLIVAGSENTRCYTKSGELLFYFISALPGGHNVGGDEPSRKVTILDCIWNHKKQTYYVLDGLMWNSIPILDCEAEFRFFWLQQKLLELESISQQSEENDYPFVYLPRFKCNKSDLAFKMLNSSFPEPFLESVDGFLFYNQNAPYFPGLSSDVGWLKPFMVPDVLKMPVGPELLLDCPDDCISMDIYISVFELDKKAILKKEKKQRRLRYLEEFGSQVKQEPQNNESTVITLEKENSPSEEPEPTYDESTEEKEILITEEKEILITEEKEILITEEKEILVTEEKEILITEEKENICAEST